MRITVQRRESRWNRKIGGESVESPPERRLNREAGQRILKESAPEIRFKASKWRFTDRESALLLVRVCG